MIEVLRLHGPDGLNLHRIKSESGDIVHSLDYGATLTGKWNSGWT
ncbi:uncharacterized protein METZ01_LOCUS394804 [marine metagenome]|uniref:Uncharacterized protein n=1 Tax=marine metagenome TaxID=408172 RepID=A0A382V675_9ZZZZ